VEEEADEAAEAQAAEDARAQQVEQHRPSWQVSFFQSFVHLSHLPHHHHLRHLCLVSAILLLMIDCPTRCPLEETTLPAVQHHTTFPLLSSPPPPPPLLSILFLDLIRRALLTDFRPPSHPFFVFFTGPMCAFRWCLMAVHTRRSLPCVHNDLRFSSWK
jgi:hypothetical protein